MRHLSKSAQLFLGSAAGLALAFFVTGSDPSGPLESEAVSFAQMHAELSEQELELLLEDRRAVLFELQEKLVDALESEGRYFTFDAEGERISTAPPDALPYGIAGMRVKIVREGGVRVGKTIPIPTGYDPVYDELYAECRWLSERLEAFGRAGAVELEAGA